MSESLPHFHYPHNSSIDLVLAILEHPLGGARVLLHRLTELDLVDLDPDQLVFESGVELEVIRFVDVLAFRNLKYMFFVNIGQTVSDIL